MKNWLANHKKEIMLAVILFIIVATSFGLGYLANREFNHAPIIIEQRVSG